MRYKVHVKDVVDEDLGTAFAGAPTAEDQIVILSLQQLRWLKKIVDALDQVRIGLGRDCQADRM